MIGRLIALDGRLLLRSATAWLAVLALVLTAALALLNGFDWRTRYVGAAGSARESAVKAEASLERTYEGMDAGRVKPTDVRNYNGSGEFIPDPRDPYVAAFYNGRLAELPPGPLLGLATGSSELRSTHQVVNSRPLSELVRLGETAEAVNPAALAAGRFDLLAFVVLVCPLALIALLFDAIARERENGPASLLKSVGVDCRALLVARLITRGGLVLFVALAASLVGWVGLATAGATPPTERGLLWLSGVVLYMTFWSALCVAVASLRLSAVACAAALASLWVGAVLLAPGLMERGLRPDGLLAPRVLADARVRAVTRQEGAGERADALIDRVGRRYWKIDFSRAPACSRRRDALKDYALRELLDRVQLAASAQAEAQEALYDERLDALGWLVPTLGLQRSMEALAGVDPARQRTFEIQMQDFHQRWRRHHLGYILGCRLLDRADFEAAPRFLWQEPPLPAATLAGGFGSLAALAAALLVFALRPGSL